MKKEDLNVQPAPRNSSICIFLKTLLSESVTFFHQREKCGEYKKFWSFFTHYVV